MENSKYERAQNDPSRLFLNLPSVQYEREFRLHLPNKVMVYEFYTISDGCRKIYTNNDGIEGNNKILDPLTVSYTSLFINGVLQPRENYVIQEGKLLLLTEDIPILGAPIVLQMIKL